jgi:aconitate hydratase
MTVPAWVKSSIAPGSRVITTYLRETGLLGKLDEIGFSVVGHGCTTCIGNSGDLLTPAATALTSGSRLVGVLSGNRNFAGRVHRDLAAAYLMSPPLVVAYALAGHIRLDLTTDPIGQDSQDRPVFLADLWPNPVEVADALAGLGAEAFQAERAELFTPDAIWSAVAAPSTDIYDWPTGSTYLQQSPLVLRPGTATTHIRDARILVLAPDATTTDHISPAGAIPPDSPAGELLLSQGVPDDQLNSYGCRRGNAEVMIRGVFANPHFQNQVSPGLTGSWTRHLPSGRAMRLHEGARAYQLEGTDLVIVAGRNYGMGSSRDWAAKGPRLLGVKAVLAVSIEPIHRRNLVDVGILPLQFPPGLSPTSLGLDGGESLSIFGVERLAPRGELTVVALDATGRQFSWPMLTRIESQTELAYFHHGGLLAALATTNGGGTADNGGGTAEAGR